MHVCTVVLDGVLIAWRDRSADFPNEFDGIANRRTCVAKLPGDEGSGVRSRLRVEMTGEKYSLVVPSGLTDGSWHRIRMQILPDGRCGRRDRWAGGLDLKQSSVAGATAHADSGRAIGEHGGAGGSSADVERP